MRGTFAEIVALAKDKSVAGRRRLATRFGHAFFSHSTDFSGEERSIALDIMMALLRDAELEIRRELSHHLSSEPTAPHAMVLMLANDVIEVAQPVLLNSPVLTEDDLMNIITKREMEHRAAIAHRSGLTPRLTDTLVKGREPEVSRALISNISVQLPKQIIEALAAQAADRFDLAELLVNRNEVTPELATHLFWSVSNELRKHIRARFDLNPAALESALENTVKRLTTKEGDPSLRRSLADRLLRNGVISPSWLIEMVRGRTLPLFREILGGMTKLTPQLVDVLLQPQATDELALICRALGFSKAETGSLIMLVRDRVNNLPNFSAAQLAEAITTYNRLTEGDAKTVMWQWQNDPSYLQGLIQRKTVN